MLDYKAQPLAQQLDGCDVLIDLVGGETGLSALACVKPGGRVVTVPTLSADVIIEKGTEGGLVVSGILVSPNTWQMSRLLSMVESGELNVEIAGRFPLAQGADAHRQIESGRTRGKLVLEVGQ